MRIALISLYLTVAAALCVSFAGCGSDSSETPTTKIVGTPPPFPTDADEDDHAGHDHGAHGGHEHPSEGPHGGHLIELGNEEYHAELLHDENTHTVTIHLLDGPAKQTVAVSLAEITLQLLRDGQFVKYALKAVQGPEDAAGAASRFEIVDAALCDALCHGDETHGRLQVTIDGRPYTGTIAHHDHGEHDHQQEGHPGQDDN
jgi:hypothetical protein